MVREVSVISDPVMLHVWSCLHSYAYEDALFTAERLYAETHSSECLHLLASCLYRIGRPKQVSCLLKGAEPLNAKNKYLLAKCYSDIGSLGDAEESLLGISLLSKSLDDVCDFYGEQAAFVMLLLGDIRRRQGRISDAVKCYMKCLDVNPLIWSAFRSLCSIGEKPNPSKCFQIPDNFLLPTATYTVVHDGFEPPAGQQFGLSAESHGHNKDEMETSSENVNPEKSSTAISEAFVTHDSSLDSKNPQAHLEGLPLTRKAYLTLCSRDHPGIAAFGTSPVAEPVQTPQAMFSSFVPDAPKPDVHRSVLISPTTRTPRFGSLALLSQSPMFACVPVFYKTPCHGFWTADSILSNSMRHDTNQLVPLRQSALNQTTTTNIVTTGHTDGSLLDSTLSPTNRCRSRNPDPDRSSFGLHPSSGFLHNHPVNAATDRSQTSVRSVLERNATAVSTTSTPAHVIGPLRRLIFSTSPSRDSSLTVRSAGGMSSTPAGQRSDLPKLRSATQRSSCNLVNPLEVPHRLNISPVPGTVAGTNFSTLATLQCANAQRTAVDEIPFIEEGNSTSGPRTRSQAAAAVARTSGIQKRSSRTVRSRGILRKLDSRQIQSSSLGSGSEHQPIPVTDLPEEDSHVTPTTAPAGPIFGTAKPLEEEIQFTAPCKDDPRLTSLQKYLELMVQLGKAYQCLVRHQWRSAARLLAKLPDSQLHTGRILSWAARAHMDNTDYNVSRRIFMEARNLEPWQLTGLDFFSTVLWQLQADHELSHLARDLLDLDRSAPEPWCAAGNCFSLQGEHEVAIRFFQRALQVSPTSAYACTLLGHEQSTLEDFDSAIAAFRMALRLDPRQYNALFGISNVYYKQEKFDLAEVHLAQAVALFPHSHLLLANLAALRVRLGRLNDGPGSALDLVSLACRIQPNNPLARYHRASILFHLGWYEEVLSELQKLMILVPREAMVYLMIGHTYKKLGNTPQAMIHYSWAMGLDPKGANTHLRDIMTNPPFANRSAVRRGATSHAGLEGSVIGSGNTTLGGASSTSRQSTRRAHRFTLTDDIPSDRLDDDEPIQGIDLIEHNDDDYDYADGSAVTPTERIGEDSFGTGGGSMPPSQGVRRLTTFSMTNNVVDDYDDDELAGMGDFSSPDDLIP